MSTDDNMRQQTLQTYSNSTCQWLRVSGDVCWRLLSSVFFSNLTLLRHQNIKMSIYKVDKNHWVMWLFCFLVPVRKILKNTVALDHPVFYFQWGLQKCRKADITYLLYFLNISTAHTKLKFHKLYKRQIVMPCKYVLALLHMPPYCADKSVREAIV